MFPIWKMHKYFTENEASTGAQVWGQLTMGTLIYLHLDSQRGPPAIATKEPKSQEV